MFLHLKTIEKGLSTFKEHRFGTFRTLKRLLWGVWSVICRHTGGIDSCWLKNMLIRIPINYTRGDLIRAIILVELLIVLDSTGAVYLIEQAAPDCAKVVRNLSTAARGKSCQSCPTWFLMNTIVLMHSQVQQIWPFKLNVVLWRHSPLSVIFFLCIFRHMNHQ